MKKTISILLIVAMMLASMLAIIPASAAPKGEKIASAADFAAMSADGEYYLGNDIIISASYKEAFKGKLDGNGKTITVYSATPVFEKIEGAEITDLNIVMEFEAEKPDGDFGALARTAYGTFENITVELDALFTAEATANNLGGVIGMVNGESELYMVTAKGSLKQEKENAGADNCAQGIGGIIGVANTDKEVSIDTCANYVDVYSNLPRAGVGGFVGASNGKTALVIDNSQNYGKIDGCSKKNHQGSAGFVGIMNANNVKEASIEITDSRNYGEVTSHGTAGDNDHMKGGFLGRVYGGAKVVVENCVNSGKINTVGGGWASSGGIVGNFETYNYSWSNNDEATLKIKNCVNTGEIVAQSYGGGIVGSMLQGNSPTVKLTIEDCANYGKVSGNNSGGMLGRQGDGGANALVIKGCYNAGEVKAAMVASISLMWNNEGGGPVNKEIVGAQEVDGATAFTAPYPEPKIENCVNEGTSTNFVGTLDRTNNANSLGPQEVSGIVNNCVMGDTTAPGEKYKVTAAADEAAVTAEVKATVPGNPTELDAILVEYMGLVADDYKAGWDVFEPAYATAYPARATKIAARIEMIMDLTKSFELKYFPPPCPAEFGSNPLTEFC